MYFVVLLTRGRFKNDDRIFFEKTLKDRLLRAVMSTDAGGASDCAHMLFSIGVFAFTCVDESSGTTVRNCSMIPDLEEKFVTRRNARSTVYSWCASSGAFISAKCKKFVVSGEPTSCKSCLEAARQLRRQAAADNKRSPGGRTMYEKRASPSHPVKIQDCSPTTTRNRLKATRRLLTKARRTNVTLLNRVNKLSMELSKVYVRRVLSYNIMRSVFVLNAGQSSIIDGRRNGRH